MSPNLTSVTLKLDRNKLNYSVDDSGQKLTIGGAKRLDAQDALKIFGPVVLGLVAIGLGWVLSIGFVGSAGLVLCIFGGVAWAQYRKKKKAHQTVKVIAPGRITLIHAAHELVLQADAIDDYTIAVTKLDNGSFEGRLSVVASGESHFLLSFSEKDKKRLSEDLEYVKAFIVDHVRGAGITRAFSGYAPLGLT